MNTEQTEQTTQTPAERAQTAAAAAAQHADIVQGMVAALTRATTEAMRKGVDVGEIWGAVMAMKTFADLTRHHAVQARDATSFAIKAASEVPAWAESKQGALL